MARYNIDEIINNDEEKKQKKQRYNIDEIISNNETQEVLPRAREEKQVNQNSTVRKIKTKINDIGSKTKNIVTSKKTLELFKNVDDAYYRQRRNEKQAEIAQYEKILNSNENLDQNTRQGILQTIENLKSETFADEDKRREKEANFQKAIDNVSQKGQGNLQNYMNTGNVEKVQDTSGYFKGSRAFDDGYQFGDVTKTVLGTVGDAGLSLGKGIMSIGEVGGDILTHGIANVADLLGNEEYAKQLRYNADNMNVIDDMYRPAQEKVDKNSVLGDKMDNTVQSVGNNIGTMALQAVGVPWQVTTGATTMREGLLEAKAEGATGAEAWIYAGIKTGSEIGSEYLFGGVPLKGTGETADQLIDGLTSKITSKTAKKIAEFGINSLGEGAEEILSGLGSALGKKLTYMKEAELSELYSSEEMLDSFISGTISSMLLGGGREVYNHYNTNSMLALPEAKINKKQDINATQQQNVINNNVKIQDNINQQTKIDSENFSKQVDDYLSGKIKSSEFINVGRTSQILQDIGLPNSDIILKQSKLKQLMQESNNPNSNLHGLSSDTIKRIPEALANPLNVLQSSTSENSVVIITDLADKAERPIIASIEVNYKGQIGNIEFLSNRLTSVYGKNNYDRFMQTEISKGNLLYDIDEGIIKELPTSTRLQSPEGLNSLINNSITSPNENVNFTNNYATSVKNNTLSMTNNQGSFTKQNEVIDNKDARLKELKSIDIANNQETLYNSANESEGGINGEQQTIKSNDQGGTAGLSARYEGRTTDEGRYQRNNEEQNKKTKQQELEFVRNPENHIVELNSNQTKIKQAFEDKGAKVVFYSLNSEKGGYYDNGTLYVNIDGATDIQQLNETTHEYAHYLIRDNAEFNNKISSIAEQIVQNEEIGTSEAIRNYIMDRTENISVNEIDAIYKTVVEEILADYAIDVNNNVDFSIENQYGIDSDILNTYKSILKEYLPDIKLQNYNKSSVEENIERNSEVEKPTSFNLLSNEEIKQRKHYKSISESEQVTKETRKEARKLYENETYTPISNVETISKANENISRVGAEDTYTAFRTKIKNNEKISLQDIATGERLIQIYSERGDIAKVNDLMQDVAILGTELGQQVQALSIIKKASPEGQLLYVNKIVDRTNTKLNTDIKVTEEMANKILKSKNQQELENTMTEIAVELGEQLPLTTSDKIRSWRYLSMLGNPKTHIKNLGANVAMNLTQQVKNKVGGAVEDVAGAFNKDLERTKTLKFANKDQRQFAKQDAEYMKDRIDGGGKYDIKNMIQNNKKQFNNKVLNSVAEFNSNMLEIEDNIFLKKAYKQALQNYMSANKLSSSDMQNSSILQKAREYASYQAQEATFHQFNALAQRLTEIENKGGIAGKAVEAILPFKKTPMNIAKAGVEYSPVGLAKSLTTDIVKLNNKTKDFKTKLDNGTITKAQYKAGMSKLVTNTIDNFAKGFTGTSLSVLGYFLADAGILKAGNDGDDDEFKEKTGEQEYSIRIGDYTYTLDWVAPSAIPIFIGGTVHDLIHSEKEDNSNILNSLMTATAKTFEPMTEMSMLQGLTSAISSYEQGSSTKLFDLGASALSSYAGQFVPTALGQVAKIIDPVERDTSSTAKGLQKKLDQFIKQQTAKVPFLSKTLPARKNMWGEDKVRNSNVLVRTYEVAISPYNRKKIVEDATEAELLEVFNNTGENVLPGNPNKDLTINTKKYRMTSEEYNEAKGKFGKTAKSSLDSLINSSEYKKLTDEQKARAIDNVYTYAKEQIKVDYSKKYGLDYKEDSLYKTANEVKKNGGNTSDYFSYKATIDGMKDREKIETLANAKYSKETKKSIYENTIGKDDKKYEIVKDTNINITEYLKYKNQEFTSDKEDDGTIKGKSVSGSKKTKVWNYIDNMNVTYTQKVLLYGMEYTPNKTQKELIVNYINSLSNKTNQEKLDMLSNFKGFTINKDGTFEY